MKKNKVIRLTENDLVNIIKKFLMETGEPQYANKLRTDVTGITGSEIVMYNDYGFNRYTGEKKLLKASETYRIKDVWFPEYKGGKTVAFTVQKIGNDNESVDFSGKTGLMKGAFKRESKDTNLPIQFRWDCVSHFEKGLGDKYQELKRYGGIKEDYLNNELAVVIVNRPFCNYQVRPEVAPIVKNYAYRKPPR